jgi:formate hydrogenlyase subunit 4
LPAVGIEADSRGRIPVDNPATHLELTMIHEAMILEYSARHLALMEWTHALKLMTYTAIGIALFLPWGIAQAGRWEMMPVAILALLLKLGLAGAGLAVLELVSAKMRIFRVPEFLAWRSCWRYWACSRISADMGVSA